MRSSSSTSDPTGKIDGFEPSRLTSGRAGRLSNRTFHCGMRQDICVDNTRVDITCRPGCACLTLLLCAVYILLSESARRTQTSVSLRRLRSGRCHVCTFLADGVNSVNVRVLMHVACSVCRERAESARTVLMHDK